MGNCITSITAEKPAKIIVVGASGYIGKATLSSLVARHGSSVDVYAGVRDPSKFEAVEGVTAVKADLGNKSELSAILKDYDRVFIVTPGHEDRTLLAMNGLKAAKEANVKFIAIVSVLTSGTKSIFGKQFKPIEEKVKAVGVPYAILRLPLFVDNNWLNAESIKDQGTFYDPRDPSASHTAVIVSDVGNAAADILASPDKHRNITYKLVSPPFSLNDLANAFTKALGKEVTVTRVPYESAKEAFLGKGFPEWQVDGILELFRYIDKRSPITNEEDVLDIERITGKKATTIQEWTESVAAECRVHQ